jgi:hypothetical protein
LSSDDTWLKASIRGKAAAMKILVYIFLITFLMLNTAYSQDENHPSPLPSPLRGEGQDEGEELLYTPATQMEKPGEILFTPVEIEAEEVLYCPVREPEKPRGIFYAEVTTVFQTVDLDTNSSKAKEYRTLPDGFYISNFTLNYEGQNQELSGQFGNIVPISNIIDDGYGNLNYRRFGIVDVSLGLAKFPHNYGNDAESLFVPVNPYTFRIPASPTPEHMDVSTLRDNYALRAKFTPGDRLTITTSLSVENREGRRPITVESLTDKSTTAIIEITEPVDYSTASIDLGLEYFDDTIDIQLNNNLQIFTNTRRDEIIWDNPYQTECINLVDSVCVEERPAFGRAKVADDYTVHTLSFRPTIKISKNIRSINTLSYSKVTNTVNLAPLTTVTGVGEGFQKDFLDPDVRTLTVSSILSTRPLSDVSLNIKFRYNTHENDTPEIEEPPAYVMLDGSSAKYPRTARYTSYLTRTLTVDGNWSIINGLSLDAGLENKDTIRSEREVEDENVKSFFFSLHPAISDRASGILGYRFDMKRGDYDPAYYKTIYDTDPENDADQHPLMRAFDLSELNSHTVKAGFDFSPLDVLNLGASLSFTRSEHIDVTIGRNMSQTESASISAEYTPFKGTLIYSQYFYDRMTIESRYSWTYDNDSTLADSYPQETNNPLYSNFIKPISETIEDTSGIYIIGFDYDALDKISVTGNLSRHASTGTSVKMPAISSATDTFELKISYKLRDEVYNKGFSYIQFKDLRISAGYYSERYERDDYALDNFPPPVDTIDVNAPEDIFLGITEPAYNLNIFSLSLAFYF